MADEHPSGTSAALELALEQLEAEVAAMNRAGQRRLLAFWEMPGCRTIG